MRPGNRTLTPAVKRSAWCGKISWAILIAVSSPVGLIRAGVPSPLAPLKGILLPPPAFQNRNPVGRPMLPPGPGKKSAARLQKQESAAWNAVRAAQRARIAALEKLKAAALKAHAMPIVMATMARLAQARQQLQQESALTPAQWAARPGQINSFPGPPAPRLWSPPVMPGQPAHRNAAAGAQAQHRAAGAWVNRRQWPALVARGAKLFTGVANLNGLIASQVPSLQRRLTGLSAPAEHALLRKFDQGFLKRPVYVSLHVQSIKADPQGGVIVRGRIPWRAPSPRALSPRREPVTPYAAGMPRPGPGRPFPVARPGLPAESQATFGPPQEVWAYLPARVAAKVKRWRRGQWRFLYGMVVGETAAVSHAAPVPFLPPSGQAGRAVQTTTQVAFVGFSPPRPPVPLGPVTGYAFYLTNGKVFQADRYTQHGDEYHLTLDGIPMVVWKDQLKKIVVLHGSKK